MKQHSFLRFSTRNSAYLVVCSSGGVPATSVLGSEVVLSTVVPADPGDPAGEVAAVCTHVCVGEGGGQSDQSQKSVVASHMDDFPLASKRLDIPYMYLFTMIRCTLS